MLNNAEKIIFSKAVILGDQGVGKTSLVTRYVEHVFNRQTSPTIGASYFTCSVPVEGVIVKLQIWDTAGQERFRSMAPLFYRSANVAVLVFDITNIDSFHNVKDWVAELKGQIEEPIVICVVGNKSDLKSQRCISLEDANRYANRIGANYFECSAFYDQSIQEVFKRIAYELIKVTGKCDFLNTDSLSTCNGLSVNSSIEVSTAVFATVTLPSPSKENIAHGNAVKNCCIN
ncbi:hypothetical protein FQA39_LY08878 [Lamprigera yunnana]|nr:hypothetical protein FQA39_LY08878 [Lamprigera yunnana]